MGARQLRRALFLCLGMIGVMIGLGGCPAYLFHPADSIRDEVRAKGWRELSFDAPPFVLTGFAKPSPPGIETLHIYIEGDGNAFDGRRRPTQDPTPVTPVSLHLAFADSAPAVLYLARPCQYTSESTKRGCSSRYWTSHRYAEEVIAASDRAITVFKERAGAKRVVVFGYSGGGAVAALLAARRSDVAALVTVAAPLDHRTWTAHHRLDDLSGSLNPLDAAPRLAKVRQVHYSGAKDEIVPTLVADAYLRALPDNADARVMVVPKFDHPCCWTDNWPKLLRDAGLAPPRPKG